jgi:hypothetical protein
MGMTMVHTRKTLFQAASADPRYTVVGNPASHYKIMRLSKNGRLLDGYIIFPSSCIRMGVDLTVCTNIKLNVVARALGLDK